MYNKYAESVKDMLMRNFTKPEIDYFVEMCNFTDDELQYFILKTKDKSNVSISLHMNVSEPQVSRLAKRVKTKILKVL